MKQKIRTLRPDWRELAQSRLFPGLSDDLLGEITLSVELHRPGTELCHVGDPAAAMWLIVDGSVGVRLPEGHIAWREVGEVIGEQGVLDDAVRSAALVAGSQGVTLLSFDAAITTSATLPVQAALHRGLSKILSQKLRAATSSRGEQLGKLRDWTETIRQHAGGFFLIQQIASPRGQEPQPIATEAVVLFSDVVGFGRRSKAAVPEEVRRIVDAVLAAQCNAIEAESGHIDKFVGDQVMAFWVIDSEAAAAMVCSAAVRAALASRAAVMALCPPADGLDVRVGLHVGPVVAGVIGSTNRKQYTLLGETVNTAARYEQAKLEGAGGGVRVSDELYRQLSREDQVRFTSFRATVKESTLDGWHTADESSQEE